MYSFYCTYTYLFYFILYIFIFLKTNAVTHIFNKYCIQKKIWPPNLARIPPHHINNTASFLEATFYVSCPKVAFKVTTTIKKKIVMPSCQQVSMSTGVRLRALALHGHKKIKNDITKYNWISIGNNFSLHDSTFYEIMNLNYLENILVFK